MNEIAMAKQIQFPKNLRQYPELFARETYIYRVVRHGLPRVFYKEYEDRLRAGRKVKFHLSNIVMFFAQAAAAGVVEGLTHAAIDRAIKAVRKPRQEVGGKGVRFGEVVLRRTYNRIRREKHYGKRGRQVPTRDVEEKLETEYRLMVNLVDGKGKPKSIRDK